MCNTEAWKPQRLLDTLKRIDGPATVPEIAWRAGIGTATVPDVLDRLTAKTRVVQVRAAGVDSGCYRLVDVPPEPPGYPSPL